jgi:3-phenylpropionate/cinnamic acid dioxygenase small subunit
MKKYAYIRFGNKKYLKGSKHRILCENPWTTKPKERQETCVSRATKTAKKKVWSKMIWSKQHACNH